MKKDFLSIVDLSADELWEILTVASRLKKELKDTGEHSDPLRNKTLVMIFEKPSLRTRLSFEIGIKQLGGNGVCFGQTEIGLGKRESISDMARVISSMADVVMARVFDHHVLEEFAESSGVPLINGLSDLEHPCQVLADLLTILEVKKSFGDLTISYVGDGNNNVAHSLLLACSLLKINFRVGCPDGYSVDRAIFEKAKQIDSAVSFFETRDPKEAVKNADVVVTDTWVSMGEEAEKEKRLQVFSPYQVTNELMMLAKKDAIFLHCLPAHKGLEVAQGVIDGPQSVVFQEAENRLHAQKALLFFLLRRDLFDNYS